MNARTLLSMTLLLMSVGLALSCQNGVAPDCNTWRQGTTYHAHETSCSLYYRCESGVLDTFSCGPGLYFNEEIQTCDLPENVTCDRCVDKAIESCAIMPTCEIIEWGEIKPYPPNCTLYIYCDRDATYKISTCPYDYEFHPIENECMPAELANCPKCEVTTTTEIVTITTDLTNSESCSMLIPTCIPELEWGELKPYPYDCNKYIYCNQFGDSIISYCPMNLHFAESLQNCKSPDEANCTACLLPTTEYVSTTTEITTTEIPPCNPLPTCDIEDIGFFRPYPPDCQFYVLCLAVNESDIRRCPSGKHFSSTTGQCMVPELADCKVCIPI